MYDVRCIRLANKSVRYFHTFLKNDEKKVQTLINYIDHVHLQSFANF